MFKNDYLDRIYRICKIKENQETAIGMMRLQVRPLIDAQSP
jgi:hypothetical protein